METPGNLKKLSVGIVHISTRSATIYLLYTCTDYIEIVCSALDTWLLGERAPIRACLAALLFSARSWN